MEDVFNDDNELDTVLDKIINRPALGEKNVKEIITKYNKEYHQLYRYSLYQSSKKLCRIIFVLYLSKVIKMFPLLPVEVLMLNLEKEVLEREIFF